MNCVKGKVMIITGVDSGLGKQAAMGSKGGLRRTVRLLHIN